MFVYLFVLFFEGVVGVVLFVVLFCVSAPAALGEVIYFEKDNPCQTKKLSVPFVPPVYLKVYSAHAICIIYLSCVVV